MARIGVWFERIGEGNLVFAQAHANFFKIFWDSERFAEEVGGECCGESGAVPFFFRRWEISKESEGDS